MRVRGWLPAAALAAACITAAASADHQSPERGLAEAERFREYRVYHLGESFRDLPLTAAWRGRDAIRRRPTFDFIYGDCDPAPCAPPYDIQNYAACSRNLAAIDAPHRRVPSIRGASVYRFSPGEFERLEVFTGRTNVVVFADGYRRARRAVKALQSADGRVQPDDPLPAAARGATRGRLRCSR